MDMMAIRRRVLMASKKRLPSAYQEVEYIRSSEGASIDTGISWDTSESNYTYPFVLDIDCSTETYAGTSTNIIVSFTSNGSSATWIGMTGQSMLLSLGSGVNFLTSADVRTVKHIEYYGKRIVATVNGETLERKRSAYTASRLFLFRASTYTYMSNTTLYSATLYHGEEKLAEYIPCYRKSDGEIGLYDLVSKTFLINTGTGTFLKGADV